MLLRASASAIGPKCYSVVAPARGASAWQRSGRCCGASRPVGTHAMPSQDHGAGGNLHSRHTLLRAKGGQTETSATWGRPAARPLLARRIFTPAAAKGCLACALDARGCAPRRTAGAAARAGWCACALGRSVSTAAAARAPSLRLEHPPAATDDPPSYLVSIGRRAAAAYAACADACLVLMCGYDLHVRRLTARSLPARARAGWLPGTHTAMALKHTPPVRRPPRPRQRRSRPQPSSAS